MMSFARQQCKLPPSLPTLDSSGPWELGKLLASSSGLHVQPGSERHHQDAPRISVPTRGQFHVGAGAGKPGMFLVRV